MTGTATTPSARTTTSIKLAEEDRTDPATISRSTCLEATASWFVWIIATSCPAAAVAHRSPRPARQVALRAASRRFALARRIAALRRGGPRSDMPPRTPWPLRPRRESSGRSASSAGLLRYRSSSVHGASTYERVWQYPRILLSLPLSRPSHCLASGRRRTQYVSALGCSCSSVSSLRTHLQVDTPGICALGLELGDAVMKAAATYPPASHDDVRALGGMMPLRSERTRREDAARSA